MALPLGEFTVNSASRRNLPRQVGIRNGPVDADDAFDKHLEVARAQLFVVGVELRLRDAGRRACGDFLPLR
jgi:hypothetical protein